ncbi:Serine/threonine-protein kinase PrkC [Symmachiella macrocystis]|uniref:Serine/threonine-protein kinase PrkC n=2 Tax=Symmachiella macrocystis TaxID=2527985 RepID=A0A5C6BRL8_9PLAN|nr:Serine/threonine-protein kinase PrkC [Symmachiella macrocystis]
MPGTLAKTLPHQPQGGRTMKFTFQPESKPLDGYTIKRAIDRGGFGEVYYALSDSGKEVALKLLQRNMDVELRGIRQCMNLKHTNLMTIFDIKTDADGDHWVILEFMSGQTLEQVLDNHPQGMPMQEVLHWLDGISAGAAYLHDRGVVHRDLKPANLFIDAGVIKIGDIGLSKYITPSRRSGHTESVGTVHYMAPEVAHGRYGNELDVYSTAVMVYEMITGTVPFDGESTGEIIMKHLTEKPDLSKLPEKLRPILGRALEKDPKQRTHSIAQFARLVKEAVLGNNGATVKQATEIPEDSFVAAAPVEQAAPPQNGSPNSDPKRPSHERHTQAYRGEKQPHRSDKDGGESNHRMFWILLAVVAVVAALGPGVMFRSSLVVGIVGGIGYFLYWLFFIPYKPAKLSPESQEKLRKEADSLFDDLAEQQRPAVADVPPVIQPAAHRQPAPQVVPVKKGKTWLRHKSSALTPLTIRPVNMRDRLASAAQSMTMAVIFSLPIVGVITFLLPDLQDPARAGLFGFMTIIASWLVLLPSKMWEGTATEPTIRRLVLLSAGVVVGVLAYGLDQTLMVDVPNITHEVDADDAMFTKVGDQPLLTKNEAILQSQPGIAYSNPRWVKFQPTLAGYVVFFAALFGIRRWWWHADAFRPKRFRVSSLLLTGLVGFLITTIFAFPHGWAALWAVAISAVVQLAATWAPPNVRPAMMEDN